MRRDAVQAYTQIDTDEVRVSSQQVGLPAPVPIFVADATQGKGRSYPRITEMMPLRFDANFSFQISADQ